MEDKNTMPANKFYFIVVLSLGLIVLVESVSLIGSLKKPQVSSLSTLPSVKTTITPKKQKGTLVIVLEEGQTPKVNQNLRALVIFNSDKEAIAGADAILTFDPDLVSITNLTGNPEVFEQVVINRQQSARGRIKIMAYMPKKTLLGQQTLAFLTFKLLKSEPAVISFEFLGPEKAGDSNLITQTSQKDILGSVTPWRFEPK